MTDDRIQAPVTKATTALAAGVGTSVAAVAEQAGSFFPTDAGGWAALIASCLAVVYTACLLGEWLYKRIWLRRFDRE